MSESEVEAHNRNELWKDAINHLTVALECLSQALGVMEDVHADPALIKIVAKTERVLEEIIKEAVREKGSA